MSSVLSPRVQKSLKRAAQRCTFCSSFLVHNVFTKVTSNGKEKYYHAKCLSDYINKTGDFHDPFTKEILADDELKCLDRIAKRVDPAQESTYEARHSSERKFMFQMQKETKTILDDNTAKMNMFMEDVRYLLTANRKSLYEMLLHNSMYPMIQQAMVSMAVIDRFEFKCYMEDVKKRLNNLSNRMQRSKHNRRSYVIDLVRNYILEQEAKILQLSEVEFSKWTREFVRKSNLVPGDDLERTITPAVAQAMVNNLVDRIVNSIDLVEIAESESETESESNFIE